MLSVIARRVARLNSKTFGTLRDFDSVIAGKPHTICPRGITYKRVDTRFDNKAHEKQVISQDAKKRRDRGGTTGMKAGWGDRMVYVFATCHPSPCRSVV